MKCNYKRIAQLNPSERKKLSDEVKDWNEKFLNDQLIRQRQAITNNSLKLICIAANDVLGVGKSRLIKLIDKLNQILKECSDKDDFWLINDNRLKRILGDDIFYNYFSDWELERLDFSGGMKDVK